MDDFAPGGTANDVARLHREADRFLRAQGNRSGRSRMAGDGTLRMTRAPRCLTISTGEDVPRGASIRARLLVLEVAKSDVEWEKVTAAQAAAASGLPAASLAGYLRWLAAEGDAVMQWYRGRIPEIRARAHRSGRHRRTASIVANLFAGWEVFVRFATEAGAITAEEAEKHMAEMWEALGEAAALHGKHVASADPVRRFVELLVSAIVSGEAHLAGADGNSPEQPEGWGWRERVFGSGNTERREWVPEGRRVGWIDGDDVYLDVDAALKAAQAAAGPAGEGVTVGAATLARRIDERGLLASKDAARKRLRVRVKLEGVRRQVLHIKETALIPHESPSQPSPDAGNRPAGPELAGTESVRCRSQSVPAPMKPSPAAPSPAPTPETAGTKGTQGTFSAGDMGGLLPAAGVGPDYATTNPEEFKDEVKKAKRAWRGPVEGSL